MIKGKSKIQLFNAQTGALEHEEENTNIVTNAVEDVINDNDPLGLGKLATVYSTYYSKGLLRRINLTPLAEIAFGGVLLWDNTIEENPTTTMPPDCVNEVGHAGNTYSGKNAFRGSYNVNESGAIENGYRHVWDFGSDKANGEIKALSLTSQYGGMCGYRNDSGGDGETYVPYSYYQFGAEQTFKSFDNNVDYIDYSAVDGCDNGPFLYISQNTDGSFYGLKRSVADYTRIQKITFAKPGIMTLNGLNGMTEVEDLITGIYQYAITYVYEDKIHEVYLSSTTQLVHKTYSLNGNVMDTVTVTLPTAAIGISSAGNYRYNAAAFFYGDKYYYWSTTASGAITYKQCTANGDDLGEAFTIPPRSGVSANSVGMFFVDNQGVGILRVTSVGGNLNAYTDFCLYPDDNICVCNSSSLYGAYNSVCALPVILEQKTPFRYVSVGTSQARFLLAVDCRYLATINNLSTPVTKTSEQTMKITYEITEVNEDE